MIYYLIKSQRQDELFSANKQLENKDLDWKPFKREKLSYV